MNVDEDPLPTFFIRSKNKKERIIPFMNEINLFMSITWQINCSIFLSIRWSFVNYSGNPVENGREEDS